MTAGGVETRGAGQVTGGRSPLRIVGIAVLAVVVVAALAFAVAAPLNPEGVPGVIGTVRRAVQTRAGLLAPAPTPRDDLVSPAIDAVNAARAARGLAPLTPNPLLNQVAHDRSLDMASRHYFSHVTPEGNDVFGILDQAGYPWLSAGENLYRSTLEDGAAINSAMTFWTNSPPHAANLYSGDFTEIGMGVVDGTDGLYLTLVEGKE